MLVHFEIIFIDETLISDYDTINYMIQQRNHKVNYMIINNENIVTVFFMVNKMLPSQCPSIASTLFLLTCFATLKNFHNVPIFAPMMIFVYWFTVDCGHISSNGNISASKQDTNNLNTPSWSCSIALSIWVHFV